MKDVRCNAGISHGTGLAHLSANDASYRRCMPITRWMYGLIGLPRQNHKRDVSVETGDFATQHFHRNHSPEGSVEIAHHRRRVRPEGTAMYACCEWCAKHRCNGCKGIWARDRDVASFWVWEQNMVSRRQESGQEMIWLLKQKKKLWLSGKN